MKINLVKGARKRESCFFYRRDTIKGVYRTQVCEKNNFKKPSLGRCAVCTLYTPYLSMLELADREKERFTWFNNGGKESKEQGRIKQQILQEIEEYSGCAKNSNTLLAYINSGDDTSEDNYESYETNKDLDTEPLNNKPVPKKLCKNIKFI